jgi:hypothetical protein
LDELKLDPSFRLSDAVRHLEGVTNHSRRIGFNFS